MGITPVRILVSLIEAMSVFLVISYVYCWSPGLPPLKAEPLRSRSKWNLYLHFTAMTILGTYLGIRLEGGAIANTRAVGAVLSGMIGGPWVGVWVGLTAGAHRVWLGGITAVSGALATAFEGLLGGLVRMRLAKKPEQLMSWRTAAAVTAVGEIVHQCFLLGLSRPMGVAWPIVKLIALPMIFANTLGAALFMVVLRDRQEVYDSIGAASSAFALTVAKRTLSIMAKGFGTPEVAVEMANIIQEETGVGAVAVTDVDKILAFVGLGADHHRAGQPISTLQTDNGSNGDEALLAEGEHEQFACLASDRCPLASRVVVPLQIDGNLIGTVQLFEPEERRFRVLNRAVTEGIGALLSSQLLVSRYQEQKNLLVVSELKLLQAQVNPHFLFNSLNTVIAVTRTDPERARELLVHLSNFFRNNLKRRKDVSTLEEELNHVSSYLEIEKARFQDRLVVETDIDPSLLGLRMPTFTLQPLIENAVRHGISTTMNEGMARIRAYRKGEQVFIDIEDNAGNYVRPDGDGGGLGMKIVDKRIKNLLGAEYGITVHCIPQELTRVTVRLPVDGLPH